MTGCGKRRTRLFCSICIFLCAALSVSAQSREEWLLRAVEQERAAFRAASAAEANAALLARAHCFRQAGAYADAAATLTRLAMYALSPEELAEALYEKELCSYLAGDFAAAASFIDEFDAQFQAWAGKFRLDALVFARCGRWEESRMRATAATSNPTTLAALESLYAGIPPLKKESTAMALSFLPPLGHWYTGNYGEGLLSMTLNAASAALCAANLLSGNWVTGILAGGVALDYTFMGNQARTSTLVTRYNASQSSSLLDALKRALY